MLCEPSGRWWAPRLGREIDALEFSPRAALRRVVGVGRTAMNRAWKRGEVRQVPFVELPPDGEPFEHVATRAHLVAILNADIPAHVWTYVLIRLCTGCRGDAALELQPFQVDWPTRTIRLNPPGRRQTNKRRPTVPLPHALAAHLTTLQGLQFYAGYQGRPTRSLKTTWRKMRARLALPVWFAPRVLRHTFGAEMRRRAVPGWDVSGQFGHTGQAEATTERYSPHFGERIREAVDAWMEDLARDVPKLRGVMSGTVAATK